MATSVGSEEQREVSGEKRKNDQSDAPKDKEVDGDEAITIGTKGMTINDEEYVGTSGQEQTKAAYTTATLKQSLDVSRETDDAPCDLRGVVLLQDKMVVTDQGNNRLKVFDLAFNFMFDSKCSEQPYDIVTLDNTTIVVTFRNRNMKLFSVGDDKMEETKTIDTEYNSYGVCCYRGNIYCVISNKIGSEWFSQVRVYTTDGTLKRRYEYLSIGRAEYNDLVYITVNPKTGILYVTDWDKGVVALSTSGDVMAVMSPPQIKNPLGLAVDDHGHIYVCGLNSHNVTQLSSDGQSVVELLSRSIRCTYPQFVRIYGNQMFLGPQRSNTISVYELS